MFNNFPPYTDIMLNVVSIHAARKTSSLPNTLKTLLLNLVVTGDGVGLLFNQFTPEFTSPLAKLLHIKLIRCPFVTMLSTPGGTSRKIRCGCGDRFPKPLPYLWPKSLIFPTLFMAWPKIWYPIYDLTLRSLGEGLLLLALSRIRI